MARVVGDIAVKVGADVGPLQKGMARGAKSLKGFDAEAARVSRRVVKSIAGIGFAAIGLAGSLVAAGRSASAFGTEINNLSTIAGVGTTEFQRYAAAAGSVQISQEKLADILKDVNDKFGDFMATGAGPLADFFENIAPAIGVTAEQFARLSGPEALQLYVSSLEKAGVSQQQMTFYMEALASDATALLPLLQNNGRELRNLGDAAEDAGNILSEDMIKGAVELDKEFRTLTNTMRTQATKAILEHKDEILLMAGFITDTVIPAIGNLISAVAGIAEKFAPATKAVSEFIRLSRIALGLSEQTPATLWDGQHGADLEGLDGPSTGGGMLGYIDENGNWVEYGVNGPTAPTPGRTGPALPPPIIPPVKPPKTKTGGGGGGGSRPNFEEEMETLRAQYRTEYEIVQEEHEKQLAQLAEFRERKLGTEEEFNELEARIQQDHKEKLAAIEKAAQAQKLSAVQGAFGDLATLMQTSNAKLFKIGQAAAIAEATISGYQAAVDAWQKGMKIGGPPVAAAFTAASLAKTGALVAGIASQSANGGGGGAVAGGAVASTPEVTPQTPLQVSLNTFGAGDFINMADWGQVLDHLNEAAGDRGYTITRRA